MNANGVQLLTTEQAAQRLAVTEAAVRKWISQRRLPAVRLGRCVRLRLADVELVVTQGLRPRQ